MNTPICDFLKEYAERDGVRMHMPGHKGVGILDASRYDITEIAGADSLYEASSIIKESEENATRLFACPTYYSTEGSSHCIRAMLALTRKYAEARGERAKILALPNMHKSFLSAVALLDLDLDILYPERMTGCISCLPTPREIEDRLRDGKSRPTALYVTSPDYLGIMCDISSLARVCHRYGVLLLVDNAHGAYLRFLTPDAHPMSLGADMACDSAHKTLPALTGGAYLHLSQALDEELSVQVKDTLALFGSTSPSYLILASLDALNAHLVTDFPKRLASLCERVEALKAKLLSHGYTLLSSEPMKISISTKPFGYTGVALAQILRDFGIECELADADHLVLMPSVNTEGEDMDRLERALLSVGKCREIVSPPPTFCALRRVMSTREAILLPAERLPICECEGRVLSAPSVSCPPAVPIALPGERLTNEALLAFAYYGVTHCSVVKEKI